MHLGVDCKVQTRFCLAVLGHSWSCNKSAVCSMATVAAHAPGPLSCARFESRVLIAFFLGTRVVNFGSCVLAM